MSETAEDIITYYIFIKKGRRHYDPQYLATGMITVKWIFPADEPNTIGTIDNHNNDIVFMTFGDYGADPKCEIIDKDYGDRIYDLVNSKKQNEQAIPLVEELEPLKSLFGIDNMTLAYQSFSPDGKWYVAGCISQDASQSPHFVAIPVNPVSKKNSDFFDIDNLIVLGQVKNITSLAWTYEPTSFVVSNGELLHKWDLDELPNARIFVMPGDTKTSVFGKIGRMFGLGK